MLDFEEAEDDYQPRPSKKVASHEDVVQVQVGTKDATESGSLFTYPDPAAVPSADEQYQRRRTDKGIPDKLHH